MSKFKVGDKCRVLPSKECHACKGELLEIVSINNGQCYPITTQTIKGYKEIFTEDCLVLINEPLKNCIIVNITSQEQHKRVQEKLFGMGNYWFSQNKEIHKQDFTGQDCLVISDDGTIFIGSTRTHPNYRTIPALEFLGEEEEEPTEEYTPSGDTLGSCGYYGKSLPEKITLSSTPWHSPWYEMYKEYNKLTNTPEVTGVNKIMNNIVTFAKDLLLSADEKLLRKYGLHDENGNTTGTADALVAAKLVKDNEPYLLEIAKAKEADEKANK